MADDVLVALVGSGQGFQRGDAVEMYTVECTSCGRLGLPAKGAEKLTSAETFARGRGRRTSTSKRREALELAFAHARMHGVEYVECVDHDAWQLAKRNHKWDSMSRRREGRPAGG